MTFDAIPGRMQYERFVEDIALNAQWSVLPSLGSSCWWMTCRYCGIVLYPPTWTQVRENFKEHGTCRRGQ